MKGKENVADVLSKQINEENISEYNVVLSGTIHSAEEQQQDHIFIKEETINICI